MFKRAGIKTHVIDWISLRRIRLCLKMNYFIAAHVKRFSFGKYVYQVFVQPSQPHVCVIVQRVKLPARRLYTIIPPRAFAQTDDHVPVAGFSTPLPTVTHVCRRIDFHNDSNTPDQRIPEEIFDFFVRIYFLGTIGAVSEINIIIYYTSFPLCF